MRDERETTVVLILWGFEFGDEGGVGPELGGGEVVVTVARDEFGED